MNAEIERAHPLVERRAPLELTVVVPTFNERENIPLLVERLLVLSPLEPLEPLEPLAPSAPPSSP